VGKDEKKKKGAASSNKGKKKEATTAERDLPPAKAARHKKVKAEI